MLCMCGFWGCACPEQVFSHMFWWGAEASSAGHTPISLFSAGTGPSFPQESQCPGADIPPILNLALQETGLCQQHLSQY